MTTTLSISNTSNAARNQSRCGLLVVLLLVFASLAVGQSATAATPASGTPGTVGLLPLVSGYVGFTGSTGTLSFMTSTRIERSSTAPQAAQKIEMLALAYQWNGVSWATSPVAGWSYNSVVTNPNQYALLDLPAIGGLSNGYYFVKVFVTWSYTNGTGIAGRTFNYNSQSNYDCTIWNGTCATGAGWIFLNSPF